MLRPKAAAMTQAAVARQFLTVVMAGSSIGGSIVAGYSNAKMRLQSFFMLITVQPFVFASS